MTVEEITKPLALEEKHFEVKAVGAPVIDSHIYTTFGRRLFETYQKYSISSEDQREIERLSFLLTAFTLHRAQASAPSKLSWWQRWRGRRAS